MKSPKSLALVLAAALLATALTACGGSTANRPHSSPSSTTETTSQQPSSGDAGKEDAPSSNNVSDGDIPALVPTKLNDGWLSTRYDEGHKTLIAEFGWTALVTDDTPVDENDLYLYKVVVIPKKSAEKAQELFSLAGKPEAYDGFWVSDGDVQKNGKIIVVLLPQNKDGGFPTMEEAVGTTVLAASDDTAYGMATLTTR
ncbi:MAG: hypothetical protein LBM97_00570 [Candidatus Nomurabacteria bacterium]|jgi:hypothetical protein|nr:hypothetical protein [Candidatus Nomurabacteria bacterium]